MRHSAILRAAIDAACEISDTAYSASEEQAGLSALYDYARARGFPPAETLARKHFEITGAGPFPYASFAEAPERTRIYYTMFRVVAQALEPFREDGAETGAVEPIVPSRELYALLAETGLDSRQDLVDMAKIGTSLMRTIEVVTAPDSAYPKYIGWAPAEDPAEIVTDLLADLDEAAEGAATAAAIAFGTGRPSAAPAEPPTVEPSMEQDKQADDVESRTKAAQDAMDAETAKHGFEPPVDPDGKPATDATPPLAPTPKKKRK